MTMRFHSAVAIGQGGTGRVLRAFDAELGHDVALKLLHVSTPALAARMRREAAALARLDHPNIARVYGSGEQEGLPYIAMQLIEGVPLDRAAIGLTLEARVALMLPVIDAVHTAHRAGLVHRDLKPANILVETTADGALKPYVVDFGLVLDEAPGNLTLAGEFLGTPGYLAPEQAAGDGALDRRCDVFSLGVVLYELITGRSPFAAESVAATVVRLLRHDPPAPHRLDPRVPVPLSRIVMQCLDKDRRHRYDTARALYEDLAAWLDGRPVSARPDHLPARVRRWLRRSPARAVAWALAAALPLAAAGVGLHGRIESARSARLAQDYATTAMAIARDLELAAMRPAQDLALHRARQQQRLATLRHALTSTSHGVRVAATEALGRALFALGDLEGAASVLADAWHAGPRSAGLAAVFGRVRERAYADRLASLVAIADPDLRLTLGERARDDELRPALALFQQARSGVGAEARIAEALLAYHDDQREHAQALLAAIDEPSLDAELLAAQLRLDHALAGLDEAEPEQTHRDLVDARLAFDDLIETARSLPAAHLGRCRLATLELRLASRLGSVDPPGEGIEVCDLAIARDSGDPALPAASALAYGALARRRVMLDLDPAVALARVRVDAERSRRGEAWLALGQALVSASEYHRNRGEEGDGLLLEAETVLAAAVEAFPADPALWVELGTAQQVQAIHGGGDPDTGFGRAAASLEQALLLHDGLATRLRLAEILVWWGNERYHRGQPPGEHLSRAITLLDPALLRQPDDLRILQRLAFAHWTRGQYLVATGVPADTDLGLAEDYYDRVLAVDPGRRSTRFNRLSVQLTLARHRLQRGDRATEVLERARAGFPDLETDPSDLGLTVQAGALRLLETRDRRRDGEPARAGLLGARALLGRALSHPRDRAAAAAQLADLVASAEPGDLGDDILEAELVRVGAVRSNHPDNRVLALHHARLLARAARRDPGRWQDDALAALAGVERDTPAYLVPYRDEFTGLARPVP
ncbi:MAG: protein kinase [Xanthomonadales bacterium]|nr:protein kinase [Xanthomonadales bacterium]